MSRKLRNMKPRKVNRGAFEEQKAREENKTQNQRALLFILPLVMIAILLVGIFFGYKFYVNSSKELSAVKPSENISDDTSSDNPMFYRAVNSGSKLSADFVPETEEACGILIDKGAAQSLREMVDKAAENGYDLMVVEGYTSYSDLDEKYKDAVSQYREKSKASLVMAEAHVKKEYPPAGENELQTGLVVYLTVPGISEKKDVSVVHFSDDGVATKLDPVPAEELPRALGTDEIAIKTKDFSVFELTWTVGEDEQSATIHFGTVNGGTFTEFEQTDISFDTTASSINLANTFSGYSFLGAVYCEAGGDYASGVDIDTILYKGESGWNAYVTTRDDEDIPVTELKPIAAGSDIYVVYYVPSAPVPSGSSDSTVPSPTTTKTVTPNADGTYTIQLDVAGATVTEDNSHYVNVLIILDATKSMQGTMWTNAKLAMKTLVETLCEGENAANAGKIDFALVTFGLSATVVQNWTKDNDAFKATCASQNLVSTTGTNWEAGLRGGLYGVLNKMPDDDPTYVIFLTDGDPNRYYSNDTGTNFDGTGIANGSNTTTAATRSQNEASAIAHKPTQLYGIYCGTTTSTSDASYKRLNDVITGQGGVKTIAATADTIESEFKAIAETALAEIGANNVSVDDGVPSLSSVSATTAGEAGGFEYYIGTKAEGASEPTYQTWTDAPGASYSNDNGVTWDLSSVGTVSEGSYYRLKFTVWPSQDAYDLIADLNNGLVTKTEEELDALGIAQNEQGVYYLMTNTHLNTNYKVGNTSYSDSPDTLPTEEMILPTQTISVEKLWHNYLDNSHSDSDIDGLQLILIRDTKEYLEFDVDASTNWKKDNIYISCGQIAGGVLKESGHDYFVAEKAKADIDKTEYWEVDSPVYHPMVIDGKATMLILDEAATAEVADTTYLIGDKYYTKNTDSSTMSAINERVSWLNLSKVVTGTGAPADAGFQYEVTITQPHTGRDIYFSVFGGGVSYRDDLDTTATATISDNHTYYVAKSGEAFTISNMQAGWNIRFLNLETDTTYTIEEVTDDMEPGFVFNSAKAVETLYQAKGTAADGYPKTVDAAKQEIDDTTVTDAVVSGKIHGTNTDYTVTYTNDYLGFFYVYHSSDCLVERIYLTDERVTKDAKGDRFFNIVNETKENTLYGGYYDDYAGASWAASELEYDENNMGFDDAGIKYDVNYIKSSNKSAWKSDDAYTVDGTAMKPVADMTYYLKEVPVNAYLQPYFHYTYYKTDGSLATAWLISDVDDLNYTETGFVIKTDDKEAEVAATLTVKNAVGGATVQLKPSSIFRSNGVLDGYLTYLEVLESKLLDTSSTVLQYWVTFDGLKVTGNTSRVYGSLDNKANVKSGVTTTPVDPTITPAA